ncbi:hypothetical protein CTheo_1477 [Ceratobasidium theobromae]|uniref:Uncharacterized protein n=1 Tax=Ceratobasidium theobromae TaxID=1582974 RepID=A0A5N5QV12_9AGAM|nr:hypothetical protein CTheo_1477 [Ceratobasidium theobromae]
MDYSPSWAYALSAHVPTWREAFSNLLLGLLADTKDVGIPDISHNKIKTASLPTPPYSAKSPRLILLYGTSGTITS